MRSTFLVLAIALLSLVSPAAAAVTTCRNTADFGQWLEAFKREAAAQGVSQRAIAAAGPHLRYDQSIINRDRGQRFFGQDFATFSGKMLMPYRLQKGPQLMKQHADVFSRIERQYGVPAAVITGFWGLESDFGAAGGGGLGKLSVLPSIATLAYDCRRPEMFRKELLAALQLIDRGVLTPAEMVGSWAGELGQFQFLPTLYLQYGVDFDGSGKIDLMRSVPDALASTGAYLQGLGWRRGEPWLQEVRVPQTLAWDQADLTVKHPRSQWARWGVTLASGQPLPSDALPASLLLPMGRHGPAFLAYANFAIYTEWNNSLVYATTAAYYAARLAGAAAFDKSRGAAAGLDHNGMRELQEIFARRGEDVGNPDGVLGQKTRAAVKKAQMRLALPADSWPTAELLERLRAGR